MIITSKSNPTIKEIAKLREKKYRRISGEYIVEGVKTVNECISAGCEIERIVCIQELSDDYPNPIVVSEAVFASLSNEATPQGVLAVVKMPNLPLMPPEKSCILLDCLQDPGNLGTIIRTANAASFEEIYLINCTDPFSPKAVRASMSGIFFVNIYQGTREEILTALGNVPLICADMDGEDIFSFAPPDKFCLCIGNEGGGISDFIINKADFKVKIPMNDTCESLNAGVSAGIAMYQLKYGTKR